MADGSKEINTFLDQIIGYVNGLCYSSDEDTDKKVLRHLAMNLHSVKSYIAGLENQIREGENKAAAVRVAANKRAIDSELQKALKKNKVVLSPQDDRTFRKAVKVDDEPIEKPESD